VELLEHLTLEGLDLPDDAEVAEDVVRLPEEARLGVDVDDGLVRLGDLRLVGGPVGRPDLLRQGGQLLAGGELSGGLGLSEQGAAVWLNQGLTTKLMESLKM
jgi:hypothetical protein